MTSLNYRHILWIVIGSLFVPIYLAACILSIFKAHRDRKAIKARNEARRLAQPLPAMPSNPVDIIANEVRINRWHRRHSSITSAKVQSLLKETSPSQSPGDGGYDYYYSEKNFGDSLRPPVYAHSGKAKGRTFEESAGVDDVVIRDGGKWAGHGGSVVKENPLKFLDSLETRESDVALKTNERREEDEKDSRGVEDKMNREENKSSVFAIEGIDNLDAHLRDESPYYYDFSEQWVRNSNGMLEMVSIGNGERRHYYHHQHRHQQLPKHHNQRYIFHPAVKSREDLRDFSYAGRPKTARLATFDSDDSADFASAQDLSRSRKSRKNQNNQQQQQYQQPQQKKQQHYSREPENGRERARHPNNSLYYERNYYYNEESYFVSSTLPRRDYINSVSYGRSQERHHNPQSQRFNETDPRTGTSRRNSYASALDENEVELHFVPSRSRSVADLSSSKSRARSHHDHRRADTHLASHQGRVNNAFSLSTEQEKFVDL